MLATITLVPVASVSSQDHLTFLSHHLHSSRQWADLRLTSGSEQELVHTALLRRLSPALARLLAAGPACPGDSPRAVTLPPAAPGTLAALVRVLYRGRAIMNSQQASSAMELWRFLDLEPAALVQEALTSLLPRHQLAGGQELMLGEVAGWRLEDTLTEPEETTLEPDSAATEEDFVMESVSAAGSEGSSDSSGPVRRPLVRRVHGSGTRKAEVEEQAGAEVEEMADAKVEEMADAKVEEMAGVAAVDDFDLPENNVLVLVEKSSAAVPAAEPRRRAWQRGGHSLPRALGWDQRDLDRDQRDLARDQRDIARDQTALGKDFLPTRRRQRADLTLPRAAAACPADQAAALDRDSLLPVVLQAGHRGVSSGAAIMRLLGEQGHGRGAVRAALEWGVVAGWLTQVSGCGLTGSYRAVNKKRRSLAC